MKKFIVSTLLLLCLMPAAFTAAGADQFFPDPSWEDQADPIASNDARPGGEIVVFGGQYPKSLNYYLDANVLSAEIFGIMFESLLSINPVNLDYEPGIARHWSISEDMTTYTFYIDKNARWSDGKPITAGDVKWTYEAIMNPHNMTGPHKISMERFDPPEVIDAHTIRFVARDVHWKNLLSLGGFTILPEHAYGKRDFNTIVFEFPVVSGPYELGRIQEGTWVKLERRKDWWQNNRLSQQNKYNFDTVTFRFFAERENAFEAFKQGRIDLFPVYTSRIWINETTGNAFFQNHVVKQRIFNYQPIGFQGFAMNMRRFPFDDDKVRKAMALLLDREKMNQTLMYNQYFLHRSYFEDLYSPENPCPQPLIEKNVQEARRLLTEAGWEVNPRTGFMEKSNRKFSFKFLSREASTSKFLAIYAEDLRDAGIEMVVDQKDWAAWARDMEEFNYDMTWAAWSSGVFKDPESMWSSAEADRQGGSNITGYKNPVIDSLIEKQKTLLDVEKRNDIYREMDRIIAGTFPYVLLWNTDYIRLLYWNKFGTPDTVLSKYGGENSALWYWWADPDAEAALSDAISMNLPLPPEEMNIHFDKLFIE
jgi:microcin C transport system substrate-binding protein